MGDRRAEREVREAARRREVMQLPVVAAEFYVRLEAPADAPRLVSANAGPDGDVYAIWSTAYGVDQLVSRTDHPSGASFANSRTTSPVPAVVAAHGRERRTVVVLPHLGLAYPTPAPLPDGRVLVVGARAWWRPEGPDKNAVIFGADGEPLLEATLGDGIKHVQTTASGDIWVGYYDEGVYGNFGWGEPGAPAPIGSSGIARFDSDLDMQWQFDSHAREPWESVSDCYALNVVGEVAWSCYYSEFPIVRIEGDEVAGWRNPVRGAHALVVCDGRILLAGGYGADRDRLIEGRLIDGELEVLAESRLTLPGGVEVPRESHLTGRGSDLFVIAGEDCYRLGFDDV